MAAQQRRRQPRGRDSDEREELDERVEFLAARLFSSIGDTRGAAGVSLLSKDIDAGLALLVDVLRYPRFDEARLRLAKERMLQNIKRRNDSTGGNHWIQIRLRGVRSNRDGVGARVKVVSGDLTQIDEVHSGRGYQSHFGSRLHFGLGPRDRVDRVEVRWLGGGVDVLENPGVDRLLSITEGENAAEEPSRSGPPG